MSLAKEKKVTIEEFYNIREKSDNSMEYIDGIIYMSLSPSTKHQSASSSATSPRKNPPGVVNKI